MPACVMEKKEVAGTLTTCHLGDQSTAPVKAQLHTEAERGSEGASGPMGEGLKGPPSPAHGSQSSFTVEGSSWSAHAPQPWERLAGSPGPCQVPGVGTPVLLTF